MTDLIVQNGGKFISSHAGWFVERDLHILNILESAEVLAILRFDTIDVLLLLLESVLIFYEGIWHRYAKYMNEMYTRTFLTTKLWLIQGILIIWVSDVCFPAYMGPNFLWKNCVMFFTLLVVASFDHKFPNRKWF